MYTKQSSQWRRIRSHPRTNPSSVRPAPPRIARPLCPTIPTNPPIRVESAEKGPEEESGRREGEGEEDGERSPSATTTTTTIMDASYVFPWVRRKHTMRNSWIKKPWSIAYMSRRGNFYYHEVSSADRFLGPLFRLENTRYTSYSKNNDIYYIDQSIHKGNRWRDLVDELEHTCVAARLVRDKHGDPGSIMEYDVPVIGYRAHTQTNAEIDTSHHMGAYADAPGSLDKISAADHRARRYNPSRFTIIRGYQYDLHMVHSMYLDDPEDLDSVRFTPICAVYPPSPAIIKEFHIPIEQLIHLTCVTRNNKKVNCPIIHDRLFKPLEYCSQFSYRRTIHQHWYGKVGEYLTIHLDTPRLVTHIGTSGQNPVGFAYGKTYKIPVIDKHKENKYVTSYRVHVRDMNTDAWVDVGVYDGPSNQFEERVVALVGSNLEGVYTREMRITPLTWVQSRVMRINLYGAIERRAGAVAEELCPVNRVITYGLAHTPQLREYILSRDGHRSNMQSRFKHSIPEKTYTAKELCRFEVRDLYLGR